VADAMIKAAERDRCRPSGER